ncbi:EC2 protein [Colletotrichum scovillei]|uniref:EC2 protein n=1 Tax=Colletotrichum scovillei TaxID=1209932 RepID=A0A9P7R039_9PEZI|nr:EC2 protein [Colletotrichum scovillei]KAG7057030.1 EC2 protein [Colletotrichum scovillei]KAG7066931.1 EC2 protein [Colletotrichum scovillei]
MLYSKLFVAALNGISCVAAMPAEQPAELAKAEAFPRGECRDERDELYCGRSVKEFTRYERGAEICDRNRGNYVFCANRERGAARDKARDHFRDRNKKQA